MPGLYDEAVLGPALLTSPDDHGAHAEALHHPQDVLGRARVDDELEADPHVEVLIHLPPLHLGLPLDEGKDRVGLRERVLQVAGPPAEPEALRLPAPGVVDHAVHGVTDLL